MIGLIKGFLFGLPAALYFGICVTLISVLCLPHDAYLVYRAVFATVLLGRNLRALILLLIPFSVIVYLPSCCILSFVGGLFYCIGMMMATVFDDDAPILYGGVVSMYKESHKAVRKFYTLNTELVFTYADEARRVPRGWDGTVYDIPIAKVAVGLTLAFYGSLVGVVLSTAICALKFIPLLLAANREYLALFQRRRMHWLLFLLLGWAALNAASPLIMVGAVLFGLSSGLRCAIEALQADSIPSGLFEVARMRV